MNFSHFVYSRMKVINLLGSDFEQACNSLTNKIMETYTPDVVIGVLTGGGYVGRKVYGYFPHKEKRHTLYTEVKIQRVGTASKAKGWKKTILSNLPVFVLNGLRMVESLALEKKAKKHNPKREGTVRLVEKVDEFLKEGEKKYF